LNRLNHPAIGKIIASDRLPTPKSLALRVIQLCEKDDVNSHELAQAIKPDPALCSRLIKVANARVGYQTRPIVSISDAINVLGFNTIRQLVLGLSLMDDSRHGICTNFDYQRFWAHSLLTAITAQKLVMHKGIGSAEEVFILGLLAKIGTLGLATAFPEEYARILRFHEVNADSKLDALEEAKFSFDHNQLTEAMLADWGMPVMFQKIARMHENPAQAEFSEDGRNWRLLNVLHVAAYFSTLCLTQEPERRKMTPNLILIANRLGIEMEALAKLGDQSVQEWTDWSKLCNLKPIIVPRFEELLEAVPLVPAMHDDAQALPEGAGAFYKLRILVVDDDQVVRMLVAALLEKAGHIVASAEDGKTALALVPSFMPQAIITDWVMPEMNGVEFCRELRQNSAWRNIYVFMFTSQDGIDNLVEAFAAGANDFMTKPINPKILFARLRAAQRVVQLQEDIELDRQNLRKFSDELAVINKRLRRSEVRARAILDNSPYIAWLKDAEGRYVQVNKNFDDYRRLKNIAQIIGQTDFDVWPYEIAENHSAADKEVINSRAQKKFDETYVEDGKAKWLQIFVTPVIDESGKVYGTTGFAQDITDRKRIELDLQIAAIAFDTREGIFVTDAKSVIQRVNRAFTDITGYSEADAVGQSPQLFSSGRHDKEFYTAMWNSLGKQGAWQGEIWNRRKNGEVHPEFLTITAIKNELGEIKHYVCTLHDITERKNAEQKIYDLAFYDALTGLPNRRLFNDRIDQALISSKRSQCYRTLMFFDLDNFKPLNDRHGHASGDLLLVEVAHRILACVRETDTVARFGGDEFVVMLGELSLDKTDAVTEARLVAEKIRAALAEPYRLELRDAGRDNIIIEHQCTSSFGVVMFNSQAATKEELLKWADVAMYRAKFTGRNRVQFHESAP